MIPRNYYTVTLVHRITPSSLTDLMYFKPWRSWGGLDNYVDMFFFAATSAWCLLIQAPINKYCILIKAHLTDFSVVRIQRVCFPSVYILVEGFYSIGRSEVLCMLRGKLLILPP